MKRILDTPVVGILGGGQLARMSSLAAYPLGVQIATLEKQQNSPAGATTKNEYVGWVDDAEVVAQFAEECDVITLENEFISGELLAQIQEKHVEVIPSPKTISLIQNKYTQKLTLAEKGIAVPEFVLVRVGDTYEQIKELAGEKFVLKSATMGYDGYGNATVSNKKEFNTAIKKLRLRSEMVYAERFVPFVKELAVMVVRTKTETATYPVVETIQENHICKYVLAPASIDEKIAKKAKALAIQSVEAVEGYGLFGVELFLTKNGQLFVNEMAPRPHNSGHFSIDACVTSQFENHIRAVLNMPIGDTSMKVEASVMVNILGKRNAPFSMKRYKEAFTFKDAAVHFYGKHESRKGRKMGHITFVGKSLNTLLRKAKEIDSKITL